MSLDSLLVGRKQPFSHVFLLRLSKDCEVPQKKTASHQPEGKTVERYHFPICLKGFKSQHLRSKHQSVRSTMFGANVGLSHQFSTIARRAAMQCVVIQGLCGGHHKMSARLRVIYHRLRVIYILIYGVYIYIYIYIYMYCRCMQHIELFNSFHHFSVYPKGKRPQI